MAVPRKSGTLSMEVVDLDKKLNVWKTLAPKAFAKGLKAGIWASVLTVQQEAKNNLDGKVLNRRSGDLWRSIQPEVFDKGGTVVGIVGTHVKYAAIHEFGGTIKPKKAGGFLVFKGLPGTDAEGNATEGSNVFMREVTIPRRPYMSKALDDKEIRVRQLIRAHVMSAVRGTLKTGKVKKVSLRKGVAPSVN